ncbi:MAG: VanZ family protein, partial [Sulfuricella sp.]
MNPTRITGYWRAAGWLGVGLIIYLSLTPTPPQIGIENGDKLGHLAAYGLVTLWFAHLYAGRRQRIRLAVGMVALGIALEYAQRATGYRSFEVADMVADALGVAIGWLL